MIDSYKDSLKKSASKIPDISRDIVDVVDLAKYLILKLKAIPTGALAANDYHELIIGVISFIFFPNLIFPKKEAPINSGRKRIDIFYTNGKDDGFFYRVALDPDIKENIIHVECKNYTNDIANPEFDQLICRFDHVRGNLGMLFYRASDDKTNVIKRCQDAAKSGLGIVLPIDDAFVIKCLELIASKDRPLIDKELNDLYLEVCS